MKNFLFGILVLFTAGCAFIIIPGTVVPAVKVNRVYIMAGKVEANSQTSIISKITARVTKVNGDIGKTVKKGDDVSLIGFGSFGKVKRAARIGVNPSTGEKIKIKAKVLPKFRPGKAWKEIM